jgi:SAM-dependent methyltransferase
VDPSYAHRYRDLAVRHWWWRARNECVRGYVSRIVAGRGDQSILDIGCGDGVLFPFLSEFGEVDGIEPDEAVVSPESPWRNRIQLRPFDESFRPGYRYDLILMLDVLEHFANPAQALRHVQSLLKDDGRLLITVPAFRLLWTHHDELNRHFFRFRKSQIQALARQTRLEVLESRYLFQWLFFAKLVERAKERLTGPSPPERVPGDGLNNALYRLSVTEQRLRGLGLPFGSSLLAVLARSERPA